MGQPKLLLPWPDKQHPEAKLIDRVLAAWTGSRVCEVVVVVRPDDMELAKACRRFRVHVIQPETPPQDMKASIQLGIRFLQERFDPGDQDRCFVAPADLPAISSRVIDRLIDSPPSRTAIVVPVFGERQGHPALLPWAITGEVFDLGEQEGVNCVVAKHPKQPVTFEASEVLDDIDTPDEYRAALESARKLRD